MSLPPLHPPHSFDFYIEGDVTVHPSAVISSGVILQASPGSQIIIAAGVCLGMGTLLHAYEGCLEIETGASLGAGVLVVGSGKIGANACIGSSTTILNCSIQQEQTVPANSLIGDTSRHLQEQSVSASEPAPIANTTQVAVSENPLPPSEPEPTPNTSPDHVTTVEVYGQTYVNQMILKLLPNRQPNRPPPFEQGQSVAVNPQST